MSDTSERNPYQPALTSSEPRPDRLTGTQSLVFGVVVLTLLVRGGVMLFSWAMQLMRGFDLSSNFYLAMFTKDTIYAVTALLGGLLLLLFHRIGWWIAISHWFWYFANQVIVTLAGKNLGWQTPVRGESASVYQLAMFPAALTFFALVVLLYRPIVRRCQGPTDRRLLSVIVPFVVCIVLAFFVNWWASVR